MRIGDMVNHWPGEDPLEVQLFEHQ